MPTNDIKFVLSTNGLGRRLASVDGVTGVVFYSATLPSGFSVNDRIKTIYSTKQAEALGITSTTFGLIHYQISEFFRVNADGKLYVSINAVPATTYDFSEVTKLVNFSDGEIKVVGVLANALVYATTQVATLNTIATNLFNEHKPVSVLYAAEYSTFTAATIPTAKSNAPYVTVVLAEDGAGAGKALRTSSGKSVSALGASLGAVSRAKVNECLGWRRKFNMSNGIELEVPALCTGELVRDITTTQKNDLKDKGFLLLEKQTGYAGTFYVDSLTSDISTSDLSTLENVRTLNKSIMALRTALLPDLMSPLTLTDGKLSALTIAHFEVLATQALEAMKADGELSYFEVLINPEQDVLGTSKLELTVKLIPQGVAREIQVNIGFTK
jgi:hypothetical protein